MNDDFAPSTETVGERLKRLRLENGLSQRDLSEPGVSYAYVSRIEAGARRPSVKALRMLARKLGVTAEYLETGAEVGSRDARELRLAEVELQLRLDGMVEQATIKEILADAVASADDASAVRAQIALGFEADGRSDHAATIEQLEAALQSSFVNPLTRPDVYVTLGRSYAARGVPKQAVTLFENALDELAELAPGDAAARVRLSAYLSFALTDVGELQKAQAVVMEALSVSGGSVDPYTRVRLYWSLGRLQIEQSKPNEALETFRKAVTLLEVTEDTLHLARAHINCAQALLDAGDLIGATTHVDLSETLFGPRPADGDFVMLRVMQAKIAARAGDYSLAELRGLDGLLFAQDLPNERGQLWWAVAEGQAGLGLETTEQAYTNAVELLADHGTVREHASVLRSYGRYLRDNDREREALDVFERAADVAANLQSEPSIAER